MDSCETHVKDPSRGLLARGALSLYIAAYDAERELRVGLHLQQKVTHVDSFRLAFSDLAVDPSGVPGNCLDARPPQRSGDAPRRARQGNRRECLRAMPWPQHGDERWLFARGVAAHLRHDGGSTQATG